MPSIDKPRPVQNREASLTDVSRPAFLQNNAGTSKQQPVASSEEMDENGDLELTGLGRIVELLENVVFTFANFPLRIIRLYLSIWSILARIIKKLAYYSTVSSLIFVLPVYLLISHWKIIPLHRIISCQDRLASCPLDAAFLEGCMKEPLYMSWVCPGSCGWCVERWAKESDDSGEDDFGDRHPYLKEVF